uniref:Uncharacterized protein n=1 Tax=Cucumis melo TaxID=3656 RepID=A0A9I9ECW8_CUCME
MVAWSDVGRITKKLKSVVPTVGRNDVRKIGHLPMQKLERSPNAQLKRRDLFRNSRRSELLKHIELRRKFVFKIPPPICTWCHFLFSTSFQGSPEFCVMCKLTRKLTQRNSYFSINVIYPWECGIEKNMRIHIWRWNPSLSRVVMGERDYSRGKRDALPLCPLGCFLFGFGCLNESVRPPIKTTREECFGNEKALPSLTLKFHLSGQLNSITLSLNSTKENTKFKLMQLENGVIGRSGFRLQRIVDEK